MGQELSNTLLQEQVRKAERIELSLRKAFDNYTVTLNLFTGTISHSPADVIKDALEGSKYLLVFNGIGEETQHEVKRKLLAYHDFVELCQKVDEIESLLCIPVGHHAPIKKKDCDSDECMICMEKSVEIVLPCSHSYCVECFEDWRHHNPTCPVCRKELVPGETDAESWQLLEDVHETSTELTRQLLIYMLRLPEAPSDLLDSHRVLFIDDASMRSFCWDVSENRGPAKHVGSYGLSIQSRGCDEEEEDKSLRQNKFMGT